MKIFRAQKYNFPHFRKKQRASHVASGRRMRAWVGERERKVGGERAARNIFENFQFLRSPSVIARASQNCDCAPNALLQK